MNPALDGSTILLWGSTDQSLTWLWMSKHHGTTSVGKVRPDGYWVRDAISWDGKNHHPYAELEKVAEDVHRLWLEQRAGADISIHATHRIAGSFPSRYVPITKEEPEATADEFGTEAML